MKSFTRFLIVCSLGVLPCLSNISSADISSVANGGSRFKSPLFDVSSENAPSGNMMSFEFQRSGDQSSLGTCTMNPTSGARTSSVIEELPIVNPPLEQRVSSVGDVAQAALNPPPTTNPPSRRTPTNNGPVPAPVPDPPATLTPEPATMLILAVGIAGLTPLMRRRNQKK